MSLPTLSGTARLVQDPELRFAASGTAICKFNLAFNSRRKDPNSGEWVDSDVFFVNAVMFKQAAENAAEALSRGVEVTVVGRLKTEQWETRDGEKRSAASLLIDSIGPVVSNFQTAKVSKLDRGSGQGNSGSGSRSRQQADDPWSTPAPTGGGSFDDTPPF